jgi:hypothetical protein
MTTRELYRKHKAGEVGRDRFLYEVRRDKNLPWVTNITSYDDAVKILKNKGIISEADSSGERFGGQSQDRGETGSTIQFTVTQNTPEYFVIDYVITPNSKFSPKGGSRNFQRTVERGTTKIMKGDQKDSIKVQGTRFYIGPKFAQKIYGTTELNEADANIATDPAVDRVNPYFLKKGVQKILSKEKELTNDSYKNALNKAAKQLQKNPHAFDKEMFANTEDVDKADAKLETEEVKKANHKDKDNEMKKVKVKALKEAALKSLTDSLKKKESINEDSHWKHTVGSEVYTPDGKGKVIEIVGGTFTVEMEDGSHKDFQINTIDHHTQKAQDSQADIEKAERKAAWDKWDKEGHKPFAGMVVDPEYFKKPLDLSKIKQYMEMYKHDKEKMRKLKEAIRLVRSKASKKNIPGAVFGSSGTATQYINSLPFDAKGQVELDPTVYE